MEVSISISNDQSKGFILWVILMLDIGMDDDLTSVLIAFGLGQRRS